MAIKNYISYKNVIIAIIIISLLLVIVVMLRRNQQVEETAMIVAQLAQTRTALSSYLSERGMYPMEDEVFLGGAQAEYICLHDSPDPYQVFIGQDEVCDGRVLLDFGSLDLITHFIYSSSGSSYKIEFLLPTKFGAFKTKGLYCATDRGIVPGRCLHQ